MDGVDSGSIGGYSSCILNFCLFWDYNAMFNKKSLISEPKKVICFSCNEDKCLFVSKRETEMVTILWLYLTTPSH